MVTPGATAYLLADRFPRLIAISVAIGAGCSFLGAYVSYHLDGATGGVIVTLQTLIFLIAFVFAPKHGLRAARRRAAAALRESAEGEHADRPADPGPGTGGGGTGGPAARLLAPPSGRGRAA